MTVQVSRNEPRNTKVASAPSWRMRACEYSMPQLNAVPEVLVEVLPFMRQSELSATTGVLTARTLVAASETQRRGLIIVRYETARPTHRRKASANAKERETKEREVRHCSPCTRARPSVTCGAPWRDGMAICHCIRIPTNGNQSCTPQVLRVNLT